MLLSAAICNLQCLQHCSFSVLFFSCARSEGWPHHRRTFSIYLSPQSFWSTLQRGVLSTSWCCPSWPCMVFLACVHLALFVASLPLSFVAPISEVHSELSLSRPQSSCTRLCPPASLSVFFLKQNSHHWLAVIFLTSIICHWTAEGRRADYWYTVYTSSTRQWVYRHTPV